MLFSPATVTTGPKRQPANATPSSVTPSWGGQWPRPVLVSVFLAISAFAVYLPAAWNGFVNYDDPDYVTANAHIQRGLNWQSLTWAFTTGHASNWHPLTWLSHMLDWQLFGSSPAGHHLVSVAFHVANALLLFHLLLRLTGAQWRSAAVAGLFALHPLHVESVAWISERKDVLSGFFFLLTLHAYVRYVEALSLAVVPNGSLAGSGLRTLGARRSALALFGLTLLLFALGLMSKPMLVTLPFVLLLLDWWPLRRVSSFEVRVSSPRGKASVPNANDSKLETRNSKLKAFIALLLEKAPFFALSVLSCVITFIYQRMGGAVSTVLTLRERISNALVSYLRYLGKTFWPLDLSVLYPHPGQWPMWRVLASGAVLIAISTLVILLWRRRPYLATGWLWFCGMLVPAIGLVQVGIQSMADRYTYLPLIGLFIALVWGISDAIPRGPNRGILLAAGAALILVVCAVLTPVQVGYWHDSGRLFRRSVEVTDKNYLAWNNLGFYLSDQGKKDEAMDCYLKSLAIRPNYEDALNNVGYALAGRKQYAEAIDYYQRALRVSPKHPEVHNNLGNALSELGRLDEAIAHYKITLEQNPEHVGANNNLGIALAMQGKLDEAIGHFQAAIRARPNDVSAHNHLGNALAIQQKFDEAIQEYRQALRLKPEEAQTHNNLGNALAGQGKLDEAIKQYEEALRLHADNPEAHFNLGIALLRKGQTQPAAAHFTEALRLKPDYTEARRQLEAMGKP